MPKPIRRNDPNAGRGISPPRGGPRTQYVEDFFVYDVNALALASAGVANGNIQIQADSDFKWISGVYYADIAGDAFTLTTQPVPNVTIQITDSGSGRQLVDNPVPIPSLFGRGELPFVLPVPRIFRARSSIAFAFANFDAAVTYNIRLALIGVKVFQL